MKPYTSILLATAIVSSAALAVFCFSGCTSISATDTATAVNDAVSVAAPLVEGGARIAVPMILTKNPELVEEFTAINAAAATILSATDPTADGFAAAIRSAAPDLTPAQATQIGAALESAYKSAAALFKSRTGKTLSLTELLGDTAYKPAADTLAAALVSGITAGIADYRASLAPAS